MQASLDRSSNIRAGRGSKGEKYQSWEVGSLDGPNALESDLAVQGQDEELFVLTNE